MDPRESLRWGPGLGIALLAAVCLNNLSVIVIVWDAQDVWESGGREAACWERVASRELCGGWLGGCQPPDCKARGRWPFPVTQALQDLGQ